ncbi:hypothetical protein Nepgr_017606 [Nepenthes gracilis]|uniref:Ubiquitin-specific protease family C19-related protein n=1 Tax=Nepenthes gracilis TaxID=150966 RepID=A0AAD3XTH9_NEPGR|nr:hypothetical protein Nepgr_017606 [Nepenthes gracilis]
MGSRTGSHQLSNGLYVSGRPELAKERAPTMASRAVPYTGGDVKKSGELGKMFDIAVDSSSLPSKPSRPSSSSQPNSGSARSGPNSGQQPPKLSNSGSMNKKSSGPLPLHPTGLITSGPLGSSDGDRASSRRSGQLDGSGHPVGKPAYGSAVTNLSEEVKFGLKVSKRVMWVFLGVLLVGLFVGAFLMVVVKKPLILVVVAVLVAAAIVMVVWNYAWGKRGVLGFVRKYPDTELRGAVDGQYVKVTGVVTCGSIPLQSSFQKLPRCVYVSSQLYEYRGCGGKSAHPKHRFFSWGCRHSEKYVADFYVSDFHSGLRALVKTGYGAKVSAFVKPVTVVDITKEKKQLSPNFLQWLADRNLSSDDRLMRLKEGYIKEGSTVSVMGVVRRHENVLMIVPPAKPISTTCQWLRCLLPTYLEGLILTCDDNQNSDVIPV